jgi:hypothetical protein
MVAFADSDGIVHKMPQCAKNQFCEKSHRIEYWNGKHQFITQQICLVETFIRLTMGLLLARVSSFRTSLEKYIFMRNFLIAVNIL